MFNNSNSKISKYEKFRRVESLKHKYFKNYNLNIPRSSIPQKVLDLWTLFLFSFFDYVPHRILILQELKIFQYHIVYIRERDGSSYRRWNIWLLKSWILPDSLISTSRMHIYI